MEQQDKINLNVQERLRAIEAREKVIVALMIALIESHPNRDIFRTLFDSHIERFRAEILPLAVAEDFLDELDDFHKLLSRAFDLPKL